MSDNDWSAQLAKAEAIAEQYFNLYGVGLLGVGATNVALNKVLNPGLTNSELMISLALNLALTPMVVYALMNAKYNPRIGDEKKPMIPINRATVSIASGLVYSIPMMLEQPSNFAYNVGIGTASIAGGLLVIEMSGIKPPLA